MKNILAIILVYTFSIFTLNAQSYFAKNVVVGSSLSPSWKFLGNGFDAELTYLELGWQKNISVRLTKHIYIGMNHINVYGKHRSPPSYQIGKLSNFLFGGFTQFRMPLSPKLSFSLELGYYIGNHCTCIEDNPIQVPDLEYFDWGLGMDMQLYRHLYLDLNLHFALILNDVARKYAANGPSIGLDYRFGELKN